MATLVVTPSYQLTEKDILTVDKLNLLGKPVVEMSLEEPVNDQNFFRNGNFYSAFWITPAGTVCPVNTDTENANYFFCRPQGDVVTYSRDTVVPDLFSLFSAKLAGGLSTGAVEFGAQIVGDLAATLRRICTFSGHIKNDTGLSLSPQLNIYTCDAFNNFATRTLVDTIDLGTIANTLWGYDTASVDLSVYSNVANGLFIAVLFPAGSLNGTGKVVHLSRLKFQLGEIATEFADDASLFGETPTIGPSQLQDGCIARPTLFTPGVIDSNAIGDGAVNTDELADGSVTVAKLAADALTYLVPTGVVLPFASGAAIPTGWFECTGQAVSRTGNPNLFTALGTTYGVGDGSSTFNVPDYRGRTLLGVGQGTGLTNRVLAAIGGEETHQLTTAELPTNAAIFHGSTGYSAGGGGLNFGGNAAHNTMPPFAAIKWLIKT